MNSDSRTWIPTETAERILNKKLVWAEITRPDGSIRKALVSPEERKRLLQKAREQRNA